MRSLKLKYIAIPAVLIILFVLPLSFSGCGYYVKKTERFKKPVKITYKTEKEVLAGLAKNYENFQGMSGRLVITTYGGRFSLEEAGLYKYVKNKYIKFIISDIYGEPLFYAEIIKGKNKAVFFDPGSDKTKTIYFNKKYQGKKLLYKRFFLAFRIFLNLDNLHKIKNSDIFYDTADGFFFEYHKRSGGYYNNYYIYVDTKYLIKKIVAVRNKKMLEAIYFKNYISKDGIEVPLKINVDDYLYNVKIKVAVSKGSKIFHIK
ncbi:MAG: hypothetical protein M1458_01315 [Deltaproteobacteria bacterium]|nr:hypothetical protein [Deltaproteobacteria bacterium]